MRLNTPSDRHWAIFQQAEVHYQPLPAIARRFGIEVDKTAEIVEQMRDYVRVQGAKRIWGVEPEHVEHYSLQHGLERLANYERIALASFERSVGPLQTVTTRAGETTTVTRESAGDTRYLQVASKLVLDQAKVAKHLKKSCEELAAAGNLPDRDLPFDFAPLNEPSWSLSLEEQIEAKRAELHELCRELYPEPDEQAPRSQRAPQQPSAAPAYTPPATPCAPALFADDAIAVIKALFPTAIPNGPITYADVMRAVYAEESAEQEAPDPVRDEPITPYKTAPSDRSERVIRAEPIR
jgi:hypothetical protein